MYCPSCGKETPDHSTFCLHCGKPTDISSKPVQVTTEWEYHDLHLDFPHGTSGWVKCDAYSESAARLYFWQKVQQTLLPKLQEVFDKGWQPISEVGPSCIELKSFKGSWFEDNSLTGHLIVAILTAGLWLLILPFAIIQGGDWRYEMSGITIKMRRPKNLTMNKQ